jgi:hypothetical protein
MITISFFLASAILKAHALQTQAPQTVQQPTITVQGIMMQDDKMVVKARNSLNMFIPGFTSSKNPSDLLRRQFLALPASEQQWFIQSFPTLKQSVIDSDSDSSFNFYNSLNNAYIYGTPDVKGFYPNAVGWIDLGTASITDPSASIRNRTLGLVGSAALVAASKESAEAVAPEEADRLLIIIYDQSDDDHTPVPVSGVAYSTAVDANTVRKAQGSLPKYELDLGPTTYIFWAEDANKNQLYRFSIYMKYPWQVVTIGTHDGSIRFQRPLDDSQYKVYKETFPDLTHS